MTDNEFMTRLRKRFVEVAGDGADEVAETVDVTMWREGHENDPETAADEEMECWEDDSHLT